MEIIQMDELRALFERMFDIKNVGNIDFEQVVASGPRGEIAGRVIVKVKVRPVELKNGLRFQIESFTKTQVFHENLTALEAVEKMCMFVRKFKQIQIFTAIQEYGILISKKGKISIHKKCRESSKLDNRAKNVHNRVMKTGNSAETVSDQAKTVPNRSRAHNKEKNYILREGTAIPFLVDLGVMTKEGTIVRSKSDKFRQINRFLEFVEDVLPHLAKDREVTILDFGCGKSYLTFAMYYYLHELKGYDIRIIGLDLKQDVIAKCARLAEKYGYRKLTFQMGDIARFTGVCEVDMVVTLHACDTATDYALAKAIGWNAEVILSVPCCQHELNRQIQNEALSPIMDYGILKERFAALLTDGLRAKYLESRGYETQVLEFIDMEHTPKNILLRAVKSRKMNTVRIQKCKDEIRACEMFADARPTLGRLLEGE